MKDKVKVLKALNGKKYSSIQDVVQETRLPTRDVIEILEDFKADGYCDYEYFLCGGPVPFGNIRLTHEGKVLLRRIQGA